MPSKLINNTLSSISSGVTQQYQEGRFDSQVEEMINCIPSITRGVLRRNPTNAIATLEGLSADISASFVYSYDRGTGTEQYIIVVPGDGSLHTYNANDGSLLYTVTGKTYLQVPIGSIAKSSFKAITIGDHTFILNNTKNTSFTADVVSNSGYSDMAFYWIKKTTSVIISQIQKTAFSTATSGTLSRGYTYTLNNLIVRGTEDSRPGKTAIDKNTSSTIAAEFIKYSSLSSVTEVEGSICYNSSFSGTDWMWEDTFGNEASLGVWKTVDDSTKLPANLPEALDGFIVKVSGGTSAEFDDYYLKYSYSGKVWKETVAPGANTTIDGNTMPHVLYRLSGGFEFNTYQGVSEDGSSLDGISAWTNREVGGADTIEDPSFLGRTITNIFFHKNRLGFITSDSIVLSRTGDYGSFFIRTVQEVLDDDPIDLAVASTDVTILRHAVPTSGQLVLFADDTQFSLSSLDGALTPKSADITPLSNYTYGKGADAKAIGNRVYFSNQAGGYSQIYSYRITDQGSQLTEANSMTIHLPSYIDKSISRIVGHNVLGFTFIETEAYPSELIVLTSVIKGNEDLQNAFHKWKFKKNIVSTHIINNTLYILFSDGDLVNMSLEVPGDISNISYLDSYNSVDIDNAYTSSIKFSEFFLRDEKGKGTVRGRSQIRTLQYTINELSRYLTEIGNTGLSTLDPETMYGTTWNDADIWDDTLIWVDITPYYTRTYVDDDKVTVMSNSKTVEITFKSSEVEPSKGFEIATANIEAFFHQRSTRT